MKVDARKAKRPVVTTGLPPKKNSSRPVNTILIESNCLFRVGLEHLLSQTRFHIVARMESVQDDDAAPISADAPLLFIIGSFSNVEDITIAAISIKSRYAAARVACIRKDYTPIDTAVLLRSGVDGLLQSNVDGQIFLKSLDLIMSGKSIFPHKLLKLGHRNDRNGAVRTRSYNLLGERMPAPTSRLEFVLSSREQSVLRLLVNGDTNKLIASKLSVSEVTVKVHIKCILRKIRVQNRTQAAIWAMHHLTNDEIDL